MIRWTFLLLLLSLPSCGKDPEPPKTSSAPPVEAAPEPEPAPPAPEEPPAPSGPRPAPPPPPLAPRLSLTANGSDVPEVPPGSPILLELCLSAPPGESLSIRSSGPSWASFVRLAPPGPEWAFRPALNVGPAVTLDTGNAAVLVWTLPAKTVDALPRGDYRIGVTLDTRQGAGSGSWAGVVQPPPVIVKLKAEPPSASNTELLVRCALWERAHDEALRLVDQERTRQPEAPELLALKAEVLEASGRSKEALQALDEAVALATRLDSTPELYGSLRTALRKRLNSRAK